MKDLHNKVAVVTGAASGIGRALAERFAAEGMKVVLADLNAPALAAAERDLRGRGHEVIAVEADVSRAPGVEGIARRALEAFGAVHIVCNNAGVASPPGACWEKSLADYAGVLGANLWGVIHGIRTFVPILLRQDCEGHVVNTASAAGLIASAWGGDYFASKHAVVSLSETLYQELGLLGSKVKVSVLCPSFVRTAILDAVDQRNAGRSVRPEMAKLRDEYRKLMEETGAAAADIAAAVLAAIREERLYILTDAALTPYVEERVSHIVAGRNPPVG